MLIEIGKSIVDWPLIYVQSCLLDAGIEMAGFYQTAFLKYMIYQRHWSEIILVLLS